MSKIKRDAWKGTTLDTVKQQSDEMKSSGGEGSKVPNLKIGEGTNKFRFFPAHPGSDEKNRYSQTNVISWVPFVKDDGKETRIPIKNARIHGGQEEDVIETYRKIAVDIISNDKSLSVEDKAKLVDIMTDWKTGISPKSSYLAYAKKKGDNGEWERGLIDFSYGIQKKLNDLSLTDFEDEPDGIDVVSDPFEGYAITIKYDKKADTNNKYKVSLSPKDQLELDDEDFDWLEEHKPLTELLFGEGVYHQGTFDRAMKGLKLYDEKHDIGVYDEDEFQEAANELRALLPEAPSRDSDSSSDDDSGDKALEDMDRKELKQYILDNGLDIKVTRKMTEDEIIDAIDDAIADSGEDEEEEEDAGEPFEKGEEVDEQEEAEEEEKPKESFARPRRERRERRRSRG